MKILSRTDIAQRTDRTTRATTLRFVGRGLSWSNVIYGQPEGVFFAITPSDVPLPDHLSARCVDAGIELEDHPDVPRLRDLAVAALVAEALVAAPELMADISSPPSRWLDADRLGLERKHLVAVQALEEHVLFIERDLRRRTLSRSIGATRVVPVREAPSAGPIELLGLAQEVGKIVAPVSDAAMRRVTEATSQARETELPQRLPGGARRKLDRMEAGSYVSIGDTLTRQADLAAAMRAGVAASEEATAIDWDGEWPVVVRRYESGRVVYRVEDALRRAGEAEENAA